MSCINSNLFALLGFFRDSGIDFVLDYVYASSTVIDYKCNEVVSVGESFSTSEDNDSFISSRLIADSVSSLEELKKAVLNFEECDLKKTSINTVFSDGSPDAKIMVIGEGPGANEDKAGIPFCGLSGKLLDKMFLSINLSRSDLYITNVVFWRPPGNRKPLSTEIDLCVPFLERQIAFVNPKLIVLAGGISASAVLKKNIGISRIRGIFYKYKNRYLDREIDAIAIFHPSYLLRQPSQKKLAWEDLKSIRKYLLESNWYGK